MDGEVAVRLPKAEGLVVAEDRFLEQEAVVAVPVRWQLGGEVAVRRPKAEELVVAEE